jgi:hypothetical protein
MSRPKITKRVQIDAMGISYSEMIGNVEILGPGDFESLDADHLDDKAWNDLKRDIQTGKLDNAKVKKIIKAKQ